MAILIGFISAEEMNLIKKAGKGPATTYKALV